MTYGITPDGRAPCECGDFLPYSAPGPHHYLDCPRSAIDVSGALRPLTAGTTVLHRTKRDALESVASPQGTADALTGKPNG